MGKFTKGPWRVSYTGKRVMTGFPEPEHGYPHGRCVASTTVDFAESIRLANVRLIAAAPDLYAALEACIEALEQSQPPEGGYTESVLNQARAALAKARGE